MSVNFEQKDVTSEEWAFNIWTDSRDWCDQCNQKNNKLVFNNQTKTTTCTQCNHIQTFTDKDWEDLQTQRHVTYKYMPGKYFFHNLSTEEIFTKYLREHNHTDWTSFVIHDYILARMRNDKTIQEKLYAVSKLIVEKMNYDPKPWQTFFEKIDAKTPEIFHQVPQILYEYAEKKLQENTTKENLPNLIQSYRSKLSSLYCYNRWKGDRIACWITSETIKLCNIDDYLAAFYHRLFSCDPLLDNFQNDMLTEKKKTVNTKESYIQWQLRQADTYLNRSSSLGAVQSAYEALGTKLGVHDIWPPNKVLPFDVNTVEKISQLFNDPELFRLYNLVIALDVADPAKARYYANLFIEKVKKMLPNVTSIEQEQAKQAAYIT
ncbi:MAG: hypothetical protein FWC33_03000 [Candidatus Bathyarchaeota archaeon]|nr:hypothetical protein [Candidatus Termiticorpusculum sp.]